MPSCYKRIFIDFHSLPLGSPNRSLSGTARLIDPSVAQPDIAVLVTPFFNGAERTAAEAAGFAASAVHAGDVRHDVAPVAPGHARVGTTRRRTRLTRTACGWSRWCSRRCSLCHSATTSYTSVCCATRLCGGAGEDGEAGGPRRPQGAGACVLLPPAMERGGEFSRRGFEPPHRTRPPDKD